MKFSDRFRLVVGEHPFAWPLARHFPKATIQSFLTCKIRPQKANLDKLILVTGITEDWWLNGEGPPPLAVAQFSSVLQAETERARYVVTKHAATNADASIDADGLELSISFATRILLIVHSAPWFPKDFDNTQMSHLMLKLFGLLNYCAGDDRAELDRLLDCDAALEAALRLTCESERVKLVETRLSGGNDATAKAGS